MVFDLLRLTFGKLQQRTNTVRLTNMPEIIALTAVWGLPRSGNPNTEACKRECDKGPQEYVAHSEGNFRGHLTSHLEMQ